MQIPESPESPSESLTNPRESPRNPPSCPTESPSPFLYKRNGDRGRGSGDLKYFPHCIDVRDERHRDRMKTALYRIWGNQDQLLYVGISKSALGRLGQHLKEKTWASDIRKVTIETFPTREQAAAAEVAAIKTEHPVYNVIHNGGVYQQEKSHQIGKISSSFEFEQIQQFSLLKGDFVALGLKTGECPVGHIRQILKYEKNIFIYLDLKSWVTGWYGHDLSVVMKSEIERCRVIRQSKQPVKDHSLGEFQTFWTNWHKDLKAEWIGDNQS